MTDVSTGLSPKAFWKRENLSGKQEQKVDFRLKNFGVRI
tara:strand:+ start:17 stop:133 length:117 start_codon:yes stop_codon:yes gene_type:complete